MPTSPDDRTSVWLGIAALAIIGIGIVEWRALRVPTGPAAQQTASLPPGADVSDILGYLSPDTSAASSTVRQQSSGSIALVRDPFNKSEAPAGSFANTRGASRSLARSSTWTVNAVLITPSYRAAIINDVLVQLGGALSDGTRLTSVEHDHVVLTDPRGTRRKIDVKEGA